MAGVVGGSMFLVSGWVVGGGVIGSFLKPLFSALLRHKDTFSFNLEVIFLLASFMKVL